MYKRYLEPNDESPITNYMNKRIKTANVNPNLRILNHNATTLKNEPDRDNVNESEIADGSVGNDGPSPVDNNLKTIDANTEDIFAAISDQLIHPNLQCTTLDAITMILSFFLQHHLTWTALEDILKLFHNILGDDSNLPKTKYFFKKFFGANQRTIIHFYCKKCMVYLNTYEGLKSQQKGKNDECEDTCIVCGTEYSLKKMNDGHFFMELPVREQIEKRVSEDISILDYNTKSSDSEKSQFMANTMHN
ncbi:uncharacterized protein LOC119078151 [Bradysia coprophila]|uniref:uncharacterized protein LOC119078151 n=1 Tax=Bradysia coprophila TaxID=38358 RepID=UPI00187D7C75|nr:uncharacterized protein LOC119078151 [Bradysia coprophila]